MSSGAVTVQSSVDTGHEDMIVSNGVTASTVIPLNLDLSSSLYFSIFPLSTMLSLTTTADG